MLYNSALLHRLPAPMNVGYTPSVKIMVTQSCLDLGKTIPSKLNSPPIESLISNSFSSALKNEVLQETLLVTDIRDTIKHFSDGAVIFSNCFFFPSKYYCERKLSTLGMLFLKQADPYLESRGVTATVVP